MITTGREILAVPDHIQTLIRHAGGLNRFGQPNFKIVWGWSHLTWIGGEWCDWNKDGSLLRRVHEVRHVPAFLPFDRFHLLRWCPPETYGSPANWYAQTLENCGGLLVPALGPYPTLGEYELSVTLEENGQFVALTGERIHKVVRAIEYSRTIDEIKRRAAIERREAQKVKDDDAAVNELLNEDPVPISKPRMEYIERAIVPRVERILAAEARRAHDGAPSQDGKCTIGKQL